VKKENILEEVRDRMSYKKPSDLRREKRKRAIRRRKLEQKQEKDNV